MTSRSRRAGTVAIRRRLDVEHLQRCQALHLTSGHHMRELIQAQDASHESSIRLALEAGGIEAFDRPSHFGIDGSPYARIFVVHDRDYQRAAGLVAHLQRTPIGPIPREWRVRLAQLLAVIAIAAALAALIRGGGG